MYFLFNSILFCLGRVDLAECVEWCMYAAQFSLFSLLFFAYSFKCVRVYLCDVCMYFEKGMCVCECMCLWLLKLLFVFVFVCVFQLLWFGFSKAFSVQNDEILFFVSMVLCIYVERHTSGSSIIPWPPACCWVGDIPLVAFAAISSRDALWYGLDLIVVMRLVFSWQTL